MCFGTTEDRDAEETPQAQENRRRATAGRLIGSYAHSVTDAVWAIGLAEMTYPLWREAFGGLKSDQVRRMKRLEYDNARLHRVVAAPFSRHANPKTLRPACRRVAVKGKRVEHTCLHCLLSRAKARVAAASTRESAGIT